MSEPASIDQIERWWEESPESNIGVVTGVVSGIAVLDVDPRNGGDETVRHLEDRSGILPVTAESRSGGGGRHLYFELDRPLPSGELGPGVDLKADGGIIVAPPSSHLSGRRYLWRPGGNPAELSPAALPYLLPAGAGTQSVTPPQAAPTPRTAAEQRSFAEAWGRAGIDLSPGDHHYLCPFHDDHRPSLHIDTEGCRWYCFGCRTGGGIGKLRQLLGEHPEPRPRARLVQTGMRELPVTLQGDCEVHVVGESHHQDELLELTGGIRRYGGTDAEAVAQLCPDPANPHDSNAVEVRIHDRIVGYVAQDDLSLLRPLIEESIDLHGLATCRAIVRGGWDRGRGNVGWFGVVLLLPT